MFSILMREVLDNYPTPYAILSELSGINDYDELYQRISSHMLMRIETFLSSNPDFTGSPSNYSIDFFNEMYEIFDNYGDADYICFDHLHKIIGLYYIFENYTVYDGDDNELDGEDFETYNDLLLYKIDTSNIRFERHENRL